MQRGQVGPWQAGRAQAGQAAGTGAGSVPSAAVREPPGHHSPLTGPVPAQAARARGASENPGSALNTSWLERGAAVLGLVLKGPGGPGQSTGHTDQAQAQGGEGE